MKNIETKTLVEIEGVVFTPDAFSAIERMQNANNNHLNTTKASLSDVICWFAEALAQMDSTEQAEVNEHMCFLSQLRREIDCLRKP